VEKEKETERKSLRGEKGKEGETEGQGGWRERVRWKKGGEGFYMREYSDCINIK